MSTSAESRLKSACLTAEKNYIMDNSGILQETDTLSTAEQIRETRIALDRHPTHNDVRCDIMSDCACECYIRHADEFARIYDETGDIEKVLDAMQGTISTIRPVLDGNVVYITKAARVSSPAATIDLNDHTSLCNCVHASASDVGESPAYCYCGAGWMNKMWEGILRRPVRVEITKSIFKGDDVCEFAVQM
jgi:hypothetical protein